MLADSLNAGLCAGVAGIGVPGCAITVTVLACSLLGDGIRDLVDPRCAARCRCAACKARAVAWKP